MGGMASVWRAHDERTGEVVAIKRLHPHLIEDQGARERFRREASAMEAIRHPNVVAVRDAILDEDEPALVMDFVAGRSVAELAADGHRWDEPGALAVGAAVADGLAAVHERGIVHRDVKPANVLVGDDGVVRLSDFGIAIGLMDATALTAEDGVVGTLRYLAPERLAGHAATPATDVWGLGTVLFETLTGVAPFPATTLAARVEAASTPVARPDGLADATWAVLARALAADPGDRFPDGAAMAADLHRLPGVQAATEVPPDQSAPTEVIAIPAASLAAASAAGDPATAVPPAAAMGPAVAPSAAMAVAPSPAVAAAPASAAATPLLQRRPPRSTLAMAGIVGALALALVVGMAAGNPPGEEPNAAAGAESPRSTSTPTAEPTPTPVKADQKPPDEPKPDRGKDKDNDKGRGNDDDD